MPGMLSAEKKFAGLKPAAARQPEHDRDLCAVRRSAPSRTNVEPYQCRSRCAVPPDRRRPDRRGAGAPLELERVRRGTSAAAPHPESGPSRGRTSRRRSALLVNVECVVSFSILPTSFRRIRCPWNGQGNEDSAYLESRPAAFERKAKSPAGTGLSDWPADMPLFVGRDGDRITRGTLPSRTGRAFRQSGPAAQPV